MSVPTNFEFIKNKKFLIFSIVTDIETSKIDAKYLTEFSDYIHVGNWDVEKNLPAIEYIINKNDLDIVAVINGIDASLYYTDYLYNILVGKVSVDLNYSMARMNKYKVNEILASNGITTIPSLEITNIEDVYSNKDGILNLGWPMVAKPSEDTAAMAGFAILNTFGELLDYLKVNIGSENAYYGKTVKKIILQTYIPLDKYDEYLIDFCCYGETRVLNGLGSYKKEHIRDDVYAYKSIDVLRPEEVNGIIPVIDYVENILKALHVTYGYTHNEVFWNRKDKFYLVESNNRIAGSGFNECYAYCYGVPTLSRLFDLSEGKPVEKMLATRTGFASVLTLCNFFLPKFRTLNLNGLNSIAKINSFYPENRTDPNFINYTRANCVAANISLFNQNQEQLTADIKEVFARERAGTLFIK